MTTECSPRAGWPADDAWLRQGPEPPERPLPPRRAESAEARLQRLITLAERDVSAREALVELAAALPPLELERHRTAITTALKCRATVFDREVERRRREVRAEAPRLLEPIAPAAEAVPLAELLEQARAAITRHVYLTDEQATAAALWAAHTWVYRAFAFTPRLHISSPVKRCGKSTCADVLAELSCNPLRAENISASALFRSIKAFAPLTLILDESDTFAREDEALRGCINSGFAAHGGVVRVEEVGGEFVPRRFSTFAPMLLAGIGRLPGTIEDRAVPIRLQRKPHSMRLMLLREPGAREALRRIAAGLARWATDGPRLDPNPEVPTTFGDREGDAIVPLLSIADAAGGRWPEKARKALLALFRARRGDAEGEGDHAVRLLADIRHIFNETGAVRLPSAELATRLAADEASPWAEWRGGRPITPAQLARELARFGIAPCTIRLPSGQTPKGYRKEAFGEAWERYLPAATPLSPIEGGCESATAPQASKILEFPGDRAATVTNHVAERSGQNPWYSAGCGGVALSEGGTIGEEGCGALGDDPDAIEEGEL